MHKYQIEDVFKLDDGKRYYVADIIEELDGSSFYFCVGVNEEIELDTKDVAFFEMFIEDDGEESVRIVDDREDLFKKLVEFEAGSLLIEAIPGIEEQLEEMLSE